jgi:release factor glutamine methyltransferase
MTPLLTIRDVLGRSAQWLAEKGIEASRLDAEVLLAHTLGMSRLNLYLAWDRPLDEKEKEDYRELLKRRAAREPVAYITGKKEFYSLEFRVTRDVLIPRPETELLVGLALRQVRGTKEHELGRVDGVDTVDGVDGEGKADEMKSEDHETSGENGRDEPTAEDKSKDAIAERIIRIADVGTGSGAIAVTLAKELPGARITATDTSEAALAVARDNAEAHGVSERADFRHVSFLEGVEGSFDLIVSNPPYVAERDRASLPTDVAQYEPAQALFAGEDGLDVIRALIARAAERLLPGGALLMEIGAGQAAAVRDLLAADGRYEPAAFHQDFRGIERVASAIRRG